MTFALVEISKQNFGILYGGLKLNFWYEKFGPGPSQGEILKILLSLKILTKFYNSDVIVAITAFY
jgi:hypothetical protein